MEAQDKFFYYGGMRIFFNIVFFTFLLSLIFAPWFGLTVGGVCLVWALNNARRCENIKVDKVNDVFELPSVYELSIIKSIIGLVLPFYRTASKSEIKLSDLRRICFSSGKNIVELFFVKRHVILHIPNKEAAEKLVAELKDAKPDLYCDAFYSNDTTFASVIRFTVTATFIVCFAYSMLTDFTHRLRWQHGSSMNNTLRKMAEINVILSSGNERWSCDSLTAPIKDMTVATAVFKHGQYTENVELMMNESIVNNAGKDYKRFILKLKLEAELCAQLQKNKDAVFENLQIACLENKKYLGILSYRIKDSRKIDLLIIKESDKEIAWKAVPMSPSSIQAAADAL